MVWKRTISMENPGLDRIASINVVDLSLLPLDRGTINPSVGDGPQINQIQTELTKFYPLKAG